MNWKFKSKSKLYYDRRSAGQSVLEQSTHSGLTTRSWLLSDNCGFVDLGRPLWREDGSVLYNCYWTSPAKSFSGPSPVGLVAIFYCLRFETSFSSPLTTRRVTVEVLLASPYIVSGGTRAEKTYPLPSNGYMLTTYKTPLVAPVLLYLGRRCIAREVIRLLPAYSLPRECVYRGIP
jgi:hypothetical protein